jgi:multidrug efflux pump
MRFTDLFIRRPVLSLVVSLLIMLVGLRALFELPIRQFPNLSQTVITIRTTYSGASPDLMQGFITTPIEQAVSGAEGVDFVTSSSTLGSSSVTVNIRLNYDPNAAMTDVMSKVNQVRGQLPADADDPVILKSTGQQTALMYIGFSSKELNGAAITDYITRVVQPQLATVNGVAEAQILGAQQFSMRVWLDPVRLAARGVTPSDVATAIRANNFQATPGQVKGVFTVATIDSKTSLSSPEEFRQLVVRSVNGAQIRLGDVSTVSLDARSADANVAMNGKRAIFVAINSSPSGNPLNIVADIRKIFPELQRNLPPALQMDIMYDSTKFIQSSISEVETTLIEAIGIVIVVIFLFLGSLRTVLIPIVTIPLSMIGAAAVMMAFGFSINLLTLLAMVLAIGLVVDDAIVVVENSHRHLEEGKTPVEAAIIGAREIVGPVVSMTITLAAVYAPIGFMGGLTGTLFREFAFTLAGAVVISGIVALTLSPMMCSMLFTNEMNEGRFARFIDGTFSKLEGWYARRLASALNQRVATILFGLMVLGAVGFLFVNAKSELAPGEDQGVAFGFVKGPQYANVDYLDIYSAQADQIIEKTVPEAEMRFAVNGFPSSSGGFVGIALKPWDERTRPAQVIIPAMQNALSGITGVSYFIVSPPALPGSTGGLPIQMVITSTVDYKTIFAVMDRLKAEAKKSGLFIVTDSDLAFNNPVVRLSVDRAKAADLGMTMSDIGSTLGIMVGGGLVNRFSLEGRSYEVVPQVTRADRLNAEELGKYYVRSSGGQMVPLSSVVKVEYGVDPNALTRYNQLNSATFQAVAMPGVSMGEAMSFLEKLAAEQLPAGFSHDYLSETRQLKTEGNQLTVTFVFALIVIFMVLAAQFESIRDPLVIMIAVPMSVFGALLPLFFGVSSLNIYSQVGLVTLIGLITKHGILMVEFAREMQINEAVDRRGAIEHAARVRLRPILMTTAAMVVGLVPLLTAAGAGAASRFSIGIVIVAGMLIGTLFTLFVLPAVYTVLAKDHYAAENSKRMREINAIG